MPAMGIERFAKLTHSPMQMAYQSEKAGFHGDKDLRRADAFRFGTEGEQVNQNGTPLWFLSASGARVYTNFATAAKLL